MREVITPSTDYIEKLCHQRRSLARGAITSLLRGGETTSRKTARSGIAFKELREYDHGDELKHIHWNSSARAGKLLVKTYEEDLQEKFYIIIDDRLSMVSGFKRSLYEIALEASAYVLSIGAKHHQYIGGDTFSGSWKQKLGVIKNNHLPPTLAKLFQTKTFSTDPNDRQDDTSASKCIETILCGKEKKLNIFFFSTFYEDTSFLTKLLGTKHKLYFGFFDIQTTLPDSGLFEASSPDGSYKQVFDFSLQSTKQYFQEKSRIRLTEIKKRFTELRPVWIEMSGSAEESLRQFLK
jgi:hypothetical protein